MDKIRIKFVYGKSFDRNKKIQAAATPQGAVEKAAPCGEIFGF